MTRLVKSLRDIKYLSTMMGVSGVVVLFVFSFFSSAPALVFIGLFIAFWFGVWSVCFVVLSEIRE